MSEIWLLVTAGTDHGEAAPLEAALSEGVHGQGVLHVDVAGAGSELIHSAEHACTEVAKILYRERYLDRLILIRFMAPDAGSIHGRSAELAFALALVGATVKTPLPPLAATGAIETGGAIGAVEGVAAKAEAAIKTVPRGGRFIFPLANESALTSDLRSRAAAAGVELTPAHRLEDLLASLGLAMTTTWLDQPYRGLEPFETAHASIFFGREAEVEELAALLQRRRAALVCGPSGAGKSSLVLAGLLPALLRRSSEGRSLRWGLLRPRDIARDTSPEREIENLHTALAVAWRRGADGGTAAPAEALHKAHNAEALIARLCAAGVGELFLAVDQFEDLFEGGLHPETQRALATFLTRAKELGVKIVATITSVAMRHLVSVPQLADMFGVEGIFALEPRHDAKFLQAIVSGPASAANLRFENGLDAELIAAASRGGQDILPLLELLLTELFERRDKAAGELRWSDYNAVGGLDGVVSSRAEAVFAGLTPEQQQSVPKIVWLLSTSGAVETPGRDQDDPIEGVLSAFRERRLLVRDASAGGNRFRAAHESFLRHWSRARVQVQADDRDIALWHDLSREARQWCSGHRTLIPPGPMLAAAQDFVIRRRSSLTADDAALTTYVATSRRQRDRRRFLAGGGLGVALAGMGVFGILKLHDVYEASRIVTVNFGEAAVPPGDDKISAIPWLAQFGLRVGASAPSDAELVILKIDRTSDRSVPFFPNSRPVQADATPRLPPLGILTQISHQQVDDLSFNLFFEQPPNAFRALSLSRAALFEVGLAQAAEWELIPLYSDGQEFDPADYAAARQSEADGNLWLSVEAKASKRLHGVRVSTYRHPRQSSDPAAHPASEDFDGAHGVLIQTIEIRA